MYFEIIEIMSRLRLLSPHKIVTTGKGALQMHFMKNAFHEKGPLYSHEIASESLLITFIFEGVGTILRLNLTSLYQSFPITHSITEIWFSVTLSSTIITKYQYIITNH